MIEGIEPNTRPHAAVKAWAEEKRRQAQLEINVRGVPEREADFARGQLALAQALLEDLTPPAPIKPQEKKPRDRSAY